MNLQPMQTKIVTFDLLKKGLLIHLLFSNKHQTCILKQQAHRGPSFSFGEIHEIPISI